MIYLDNNSTTPLDPEALLAMEKASRDAFGNPGSRHPAGRRARQLLEDSREQIASLLGADPREVIFTSGGTESNNLALFGLTAGRTGIVSLPDGEHPSIERPVQRLLLQGWKRHALPLQSNGLISPEAVEQLPDEPSQVVTVLLAHNETGVIQNLESLARECAARQIPLHVDAVQGAGKIEVHFQRLGAATLSVAAHKFHGPRGIGALLVRQDVKLTPQLLGGFQERELRAGTEPVMLAVGMSVALRNWYNARQARTRHQQELRDLLQTQLLQRCTPAAVNGELEQRLPNTLNISFPGCQGDSLLVGLDLAGVCCSLGSACASGSIDPSPVLIAMGLSPERSQSALRISVSHLTTREEVLSAIDRIEAVVRRLRT
jgi:cysteine desulfurase